MENNETFNFTYSAKEQEEIKMLKKEREKIAPEILRLTEELMK